MKYSKPASMPVQYFLSKTFSTNFISKQHTFYLHEKCPLGYCFKNTMYMYCIYTVF